MISKLVTLQFDYENRPLKENLKRLTTLIESSPKNSIVLAPELCLSGYKYDSLEKSAEFSKIATDELKKLSFEKIIGLTLIEKEGNNFYNNFTLLNQGKIIHKRAKVKLFPLGDEPKYFTKGSEDEIGVFEIGGIKIASLICFELRFTELWEKTKGADVILVPSFWGKPRKKHLEILTKALAVANQCFVICSNSSDESMAKSSSIISPFGEAKMDDENSIIVQEFDKNEIRKLRKYINIGLR